MRTRELRSRVRRGAKALDKTIADWFKPHRISLKRLDLSSSCDCIVGQLEEKGFATPTDDEWGFYSPELGFDFPPEGSEGTEIDHYSRLDALWEEEIRARRSAWLIIEKRDSGVFHLTDGTGALDIMGHSLEFVLDEAVAMATGYSEGFEPRSGFEAASFIEDIMDKECP